MTAGAAIKDVTTSEMFYKCFEKRNKEKYTNLCDVLCWNDGVTHIAATGGRCEDGPWGQVGEVGLDLGQRGGGHDESLLRLSGGDHLWCSCQGLRHHLQAAECKRTA